MTWLWIHRLSTDTFCTLQWEIRVT